MLKQRRGGVELCAGTYSASVTGIRPGCVSKMMLEGVVSAGTGGFAKVPMYLFIPSNESELITAQV